ncbi:hypothetical protein [Flavobacterium collinsii]|uniref:Uncharacterized protein n=1 Tax=Flavobacterium collinsii TaxID=1114861 RepID=A0A9W4TH44_9FLAO|nr:hypothetical protein [Flavobacterium collinsii]CAI2766941.1 conserved protein of unknown function [Flavobacterium collinsii]
MKFLKILAIILFVGTLLMAYGYVNLQVSYKYEVDLTETNIKTDESLSSSEKAKQIEELKQREKQIFFQRKVIKILFLVFLGSLILVLYFLFIKK